MLRVLRDWLGAIELDTFRATYLQRLPVALPSTAMAALELLDWAALERVLRAGADTLVVARGELLDWPAPPSLERLRVYLRLGVGLCLRHTERSDAVLRGVADAFETDLGAAQVQVFVTPGGSHGFGWHFDDEDVFIAQTAGCKDYYFRPNTVTRAPAHAREFAAYARERSPLAAATLVSGDFLYIPARWWHMAVCQHDALSISVGVVPRSAGAPLASDHRKEDP